MKLAELPEVMTIEQVAEYLHVGRSTAYDAARRGELPVVRLGRRLLIPKARLEQLLGGDVERNETAAPHLRNEPRPGGAEPRERSVECLPMLQKR